MPAHRGKEPAMSANRPRLQPNVPAPRYAVALLLALALLLPGLAAAPLARAAACTVTSAADSGPGTLRDAFNSTKVTGCTSITFSLPGSAPWVITLNSELAYTRPFPLT